jgi:hypothetical protein
MARAKGRPRKFPKQPLPEDTVLPGEDVEVVEGVDITSVKDAKRR